MPTRLRVQQFDGRPDVADAFVALFAGAPDAVWLDAGPDAEDGRSIIATGTVVAASSLADGSVRVSDGDTSTQRQGTMLAFLRADLAARERIAARTPEPSFALGWVGWLGYESGAEALGLPVSIDDGPAAAMLFADRAVVFDHGAGTVELLVLDGESAPSSADAADAWLAATAARLHAADGAAAAYVAAHPLPVAAPATWRHDDDAYLAMIRSCQESICAGDAYQLCLTNRADAASAADPLAVHLRLRAASPAHHAGFLRIAGTTLVSSSPEQFLAVTASGSIRSKPIKGTRPRGATVSADLALRAELEASEKERAENVMIVDLMRNDIGRVSEVGSVGVRHLLAVESYAQVHQLVSTVEGRLRDGLGAVDAIEACFPAGSMTGAPKLSAMRILSGLERGPRGVYSGCFGYLGLDGAADLAMVIRSIVYRDGGVAIGAGGGITALSVPEEELEEVRIKARALFAAAGLFAAGAQEQGNGSQHGNV
ncbi:anthranilate synthase [Leifsonia sp. Root227]|uniref:aminodeoxychorismate synthase component I n=1 Tax=Leifsonia sp. Root227 TaxID=1736496 RepID=UPI0006FE4DB1|nr:aminodeoxychorismate synthase component I [Leifsonia sp. Root227]KRC50972.1 anthranilate synthase [Leifsonia sp. Root227]